MSSLHIRNAYYPIVDVVKCVMAIFVVAIHTHPQSIIGSPSLENLILRAYQMAVPYFFVVSGFFLGNKIWGQEPLQYVRRWLKHVFVLYAIWTVLYLPYTFYGFWIEQTRVTTAVIVFARNFLLVGENYMSWPLWYLLGMLVAGVIIYLFLRLGLGLKPIIVCAVLLLLVGAWLDYNHDNDVMNPIVQAYFRLFKSTRNGLFQGFPYMVMGLMIAKGMAIIRNYLLILALGCSSFIIWLLGCDYALFLVIYFLVQTLLKSVRTEEPKLHHGNMSLRIISNVIYFTHMMWVGVFVLFFRMENGMTVFLSSLLVSMVASYIVGRNLGNRWVKLCFC